MSWTNKLQQTRYQLADLIVAEHSLNMLQFHGIVNLKYFENVTFIQHNTRYNKLSWIERHIQTTLLLKENENANLIVLGPIFYCIFSVLKWAFIAIWLTLAGTLNQLNILHIYYSPHSINIQSYL